MVELHQPTASVNPATIVHIQEAHTNYEAQQHLVGILKRLIEQHGLELILVEGGEGDVSLAYLRHYGPPDNRRQVAEKYLKLGIISAEEYLDIASDYPLILWGVERKDLYQEHVKTFLDTESLRERLRPTMASVQQAIEALTPRLLDPAVVKLEAATEAFEAEQLGVAEYADLLSGFAKRTGIAQEKDYPNVARFLHVRQLEQAVNLERVPQEQRALMEQLSDRVDEAKLDGLIAKAREMKAGTLTREAFYEHLEQLAAKSGLSLDPYPHLSRYISYLQQSRQIRPTVLADELEQLAARLQRDLVTTPQGRQLQTVAEQLDLIDKLLDLKLSPQEYQRLKELRVEGSASSWASFLNQQLLSQGLPSRTLAGLDELEAARPTLTRFYEAALVRDEALVHNTMEKLAKTKERLAALITGGFHSPQITKFLTERGVGVLVVAPKTSQATDERLYHAVLKYKSGHGSFEEVQAAANQTPIAVGSKQ